MRPLPSALFAILLASCHAASTPLAAAPAPMTGAQPSSKELPIDADDGIWGSPEAPVTCVVFTDLECPFCAEGHAALSDLQRRYGPDQLRVVVKHVPLRGHRGAIPAARVAQAILELSGRTKFFEYLDRAFQHQDQVARGGALELALPLGIDAAALAERAGSARIGQQVLADVELAERLAVTALPHVRINGRGFTGVRPVETLRAAIDIELVEVRRLRSTGVRSTEIYSRRVRENLNLPEPD